MKRMFFKKIWVMLIVLIIMMVTLVACSNEDSSGQLQGTIWDSNIAMVQNGYPVLIPNITYKEAYDYFFDNPQWRGFEADDGSDVVEFSGECLYYDEEAEVYIQFVLDDEESFSMWYVGIIVGEEQFDADDQLFIELVYTPFATYSEEVLGETLSQDVQDAFSEMYDSLGTYE